MTTQTLPPTEASSEEQEATARLEILTASAEHLEAALRELADYRRARSEASGGNETPSRLSRSAYAQAAKAA